MDKANYIYMIPSLKFRHLINILCLHHSLNSKTFPTQVDIVDQEYAKIHCFRLITINLFYIIQSISN